MELKNPREIAALLTAEGHTVVERTVRKACQNGELKAEQIGGRYWLINPADAREWVKGIGQRHKPGSKKN